MTDGLIRPVGVGVPGSPEVDGGLRTGGPRFTCHSTRSRVGDGPHGGRGRGLTPVRS